jgi:CRP-like cAMP-binding protein
MTDTETQTQLDDADFSYPVPAGERVFEEGETGAEMFIIQSGEVEILKTGDNQEHRLALLEEGDFFGEMAILENMPRTASARAVTDCQLVRIDRSTFDQLVRNDPEIAIRMLRKLSHRLRQAGPALIDEHVEAPLSLEAESLPTTSRLKPSTPRLMCQDPKIEVPLDESGTTTIGRYDSSTGIHPVVDLKPLDVHRSTSRRHAVIELRDGAFFLRDEVGSANGTFVNGNRLERGCEVRISHGDALQFGLVEMVFLNE